MERKYQGSVKDLLGPARIKNARDGQSVESLIFKYTDSYSVFDWGKMPDQLKGKGQSLAIMTSYLFEQLENPEAWREFSRSSDALALRRGISHVCSGLRLQDQMKSQFSSAHVSLSTIFNELGERLQDEGLRTHFLGCLTEENSSQGVLTSSMNQPFHHIAVRKVNVVHPTAEMAFGREVINYTAVRKTPTPRLVPLEVIFRFQCPSGSSLISRSKSDRAYMSSLALPTGSNGEKITEIKEGMSWEFPLLEVSTKLEPSDRYVQLTEALAISGCQPKQLEEILLKTAWVAGFLKAHFGALGLEVADGKLEWAMDSEGRCFLIDAIGPDELRILKDGVQLSKELLRNQYRKLPWYESMKRAKRTAALTGISDWKRAVPEPPPGLPSEQIRLVSEVYRSLANAVTGKKWFPDAVALETLLEQVKELKNEGTQGELFQEKRKPPNETGKQ